MPVTADAVDASIGPVPSFLAPGPNVVAQALLADASLRARTPTELSRLLHVTVQDARIGIGAIIGMTQRMGGRQGATALQNEPSLGHAIGPFMSLDTAMARYGSAMGPMMHGPTPSPLWSPDILAPDRQWGAGALEAGFSGAHSRGRGHSGPRDYGEAGDVGPALEQAALQLIDDLAREGCAALAGNFQIAYNAVYSPEIVVDDEYGKATKAALERVIADAAVPTLLAEKTAPPACAYAPRPSTSHPTASPSAAPTAPVMQALMLGGSRRPFDRVDLWGLATAALVVGAILISRSKHPPRWARKIGLHR